MTDILTPHQRSLLMSKVRGKDTKPEWVLRTALHSLGLRYTLRNNRLPGNPDLVFRKYKTVVFVHGCFWHRHGNCKRSTIPDTNALFWKKKFDQNVERDQRNIEALEAQGWRVLVVWECELYRDTIATIARVAESLLDDRKINDAYAVKFGAMNGRELLQIAEKKVRYRIDRKK